jgi:(p)ppGpp synthase/HD superfamily hydrolase
MTAIACQAHAGQRYGDAPYSDHLEAVVALLEPYGETAATLGWLHDIVEDTPVSLAEIAERFGPFVAHCVALLTDPPGASRAERKAASHRKLANVPPPAARRRRPPAPRSPPQIAYP